MLKAQVERRSRELVERRDELEAERDSPLPRTRELQRLIDIIEWLPDAVVALDGWRRQAADLADTAQRSEAAQRRARELREQEKEQQRLRDAAGQARSVELDLEEAQRLLPTAMDFAQRGHRMAMRVRAGARELEAELATERALQPLRERATELPDLRTADQRDAQARSAVTEAEAAEQRVRVAHVHAVELLEEARQASGLTRRFRGLPKPEQQEQVVSERESELRSAESALQRAGELVDQTTEVLTEVRSLSAEIESHGPARDVATCELLLTGEATSAQMAETAAREAADRVADLQRTVREGSETAAAFRREHGDPSDIIAEFETYNVALAAATQEFMTLAREVAQLRTELTDKLQAPAAAVVEWRLAPAADGTAEARLATIETAVGAGRAVASRHDLVALRTELAPLHTRLSDLERELVQIADALERIEDTVIAEATIIATTLTRAYLRDSIHGRRFDTVVLDEASMAPIPALWVAASLADEGRRCRR